jgi:hypothetical protein
MDILADRIGGLVERREDVGVVAEWDPAILNAMTQGISFSTTPAGAN